MDRRSIIKNTRHYDVLAADCYFPAVPGTGGSWRLASKFLSRSTPFGAAEVVPGRQEMSGGKFEITVHTGELMQHSVWSMACK
jgi:TRAP-type mannitol/chloroaromatic compound transport system substrate-binding protein